MHKIIATLGPASMNEDTVQKMDSAGVNIFRINLSHTDIDDFEGMFDAVSSWTGKPVCPDTEGEQLRTGRISGQTGFRVLYKGDTIDLGTQLPLSIESPEEVLLPGDILHVDFDEAILEVLELRKTCAVARVIKEGVAHSYKGIATSRNLNLPSFTSKDTKAFEILRGKDVQSVFFSFCSRPEEVNRLRGYFDHDIVVVSKIESELGMRNLEGICLASDEILIDRGDLSRDVPLEKIPYAQEYIMHEANRLGRSVNVATNLMESMVYKPQPTRAEVHDIVQTLEEGAVGLVLAAETAVGRYPVESVRIMKRIIDGFETRQPNIINWIVAPVS